MKGSLLTSQTAGSCSMRAGEKRPERSPCDDTWAIAASLPVCIHASVCSDEKRDDLVILDEITAMNEMSPTMNAMLDNPISAFWSSAADTGLCDDSLDRTQLLLNST